MKEKVTLLIKPLLHLLFPPRCPFCGKIVEQEVHACRDCLPKIPFILPPVCPSCGCEKTKCKCKGAHHAYERCIGLMEYKGKGASATKHFKHKCTQDIAEYFGKLLAAAVKREEGDHRFDYITAVPLYRQEKQQRGANQAEILGKSLAKEMGIPYLETLEKTRKTALQRTLPSLQRKGNVFGVFAPKNATQFAEKNLILVDDVRTTGATLDECAKTLKLYGAASVWAAALSLTSRSEDK